MPEVIDNGDGSMTFTLNSNELRDFVDNQVPDFKKFVEFVEGAELRKALDFIKSVLR